MPRYFLTLSYRGTRYNGWQVQPNAPSVQATLEAALSTLLRQTVDIVGCGRTDTGVHARHYVAHFDAENDLPPTFLIRLNALLPDDVAAHDIHPVAADAHARFDAWERSYEYHIALRKDPFAVETAWFFPQHQRLDLVKMQETARLLPQYADFFPFCKTHSGLDTYHCELRRAEWQHLPEQHRLVFHITANRFLRGMVRLVVGACLNVGLGKIQVADVREALEEQKTIKQALSVPPQGLFLTEVRYGPTPSPTPKKGGEKRHMP